MTTPDRPWRRAPKALSRFLNTATTGTQKERATGQMAGARSLSDRVLTGQVMVKVSVAVYRPAGVEDGAVRVNRPSM
jgi:hypothetical protein